MQLDYDNNHYQKYLMYKELIYEKENKTIFTIIREQTLHVIPHCQIIHIFKLLN